MARQINDESAANTGRDSLVYEKLHDVEQIARMLAVHRRRQLAAIYVFERHLRDLEVRLQRLARIRRQRRRAARMDDAAYDEVDLDAGTPHQQLGRPRVCCGRRVGSESPTSLNWMPKS